MSITLKLSGTESILHSRYFPPITLQDDSEMCLLSLICWNSISNIDETNNCFYYDDKKIEIPTGCYELSDISDYLKNELQTDHLASPNEQKKIENEAIILDGNHHTLKTELMSRYIIDFTKPRNIGSILGFENFVTEPFKRYTSNKLVNILKVQVIRVSCNLISNSYEEGQDNHIIYEFFPGVPSGFKIIENPPQLIYYNLRERVINEIEIRLTDQNGELINLRGETIHLRLHIRPKFNANYI